MVEDKLKRLLSGLDTMLGTDSTLQYDRGYDAVFNDAEQAEFIKDVVRTRFRGGCSGNVREPAMRQKISPAISKRITVPFFVARGNGSGKTCVAAP